MLLALRLRVSPDPLLFRSARALPDLRGIQATPARFLFEARIAQVEPSRLRVTQNRWRLAVPKVCPISDEYLRSGPR